MQLALLLLEAYIYLFAMINNQKNLAFEEYTNNVKTLLKRQKYALINIYYHLVNVF